MLGSIKIGQSPPPQRLSPLSGKNILRRVKIGDFSPPSKDVFKEQWSAEKGFLGLWSNIFGGAAGLLAFFGIISLFTYHDVTSHSYYYSNDNSWIFLIIGIVFLPASALAARFWLFPSEKYKIIVVVAEGFVYGEATKAKVYHVINFDNVVSIGFQDTKLTIVEQPEGKWKEVSIDLGFLDPFMRNRAVNTIRNAYASSRKRRKVQV